MIDFIHFMSRCNFVFIIFKILLSRITTLDGKLAEVS